MVEIVYQKTIHPKPLNKKNLIAIDLGVCNIITTVSNNGLKPFVIKGEIVNSINQFYNKMRARIQSTYEHQGITTGKSIRKLTQKRNKKINDYCHKTIKKIIDLCME